MCGRPGSRALFEGWDVGASDGSGGCAADLVCSEKRAQRGAAYDPASVAARNPRSRGSWADLMRRAFGYDLLTCPRCAGKMVLLASILDRATVGRILGRLGLPTQVPMLTPSRASPMVDLFPDEVA